MNWEVFYNDYMWLTYNTILTVIILGIITISCGFLWSKNFKQYLHNRRRMMELAKSLPGLPTLPIIGNALTLWDSNRAVVILAEISRKMNAPTYKFWLGPVLKVIVTDPRDVEIILTSGGIAEKDELYALAEPCITSGIFIGSGPAFKAHKRIIVPMLNNSKILTKYYDRFNHHSRVFIEVLDKKVGKGEFDVNHDIMHCIADIVFDTLLGLPGTAQQGLVHPMVDIVNVMPNITFLRIMKPWLYPKFTFYRSKIGREYLENTKICHKFIDDEVNKRIDKIKMMRNNDYLDSDDGCKAVCDILLEYLVKNEMWTPEEMRSEVITLFLGSQDTLEGVCTFVILMMAMHPEVQAKARKEIDNVLKGDDNVTEADVSNFKYLELIIRETVRLFPVAPLMPRKMTKDLKISTCTLPEGCSIFMLPFATHRDPKYWDEPEKFIPERLLPENSKNRHPYAFMPFSGGLRSCPGSKYGMISLKITLAHFLKSYQVNTTMRLEELRIYTHISTRSLDGYKISLEKIQLKNESCNN